MEVYYKLKEVDLVVAQLIANVKTKTLLFYGNMGVGKTTLIKAIVKHLGSNDNVSSPTFSIVNEYSLGTSKIYHFDLYRVTNLEEAYNFGIEDYLNSNCWKLIEWPELLEPVIDNYDHIYIDIDKNNNRVLKL